MRLALELCCKKDTLVVLKRTIFDCLIEDFKQINESDLVVNPDGNDRFVKCQLLSKQKESPSTNNPSSIDENLVIFNGEVYLHQM
jgi:hypothetical protein